MVYALLAASLRGRTPKPGATAMFIPILIRILMR